MTEPWGPGCSERRTLSEIVCDGSDQEAANSGEGGDLNQERVLAAGAGHKDPSVQYDQCEFQQAQRGGPGELFDEQGLARRLLGVYSRSGRRYEEHTLRAHPTSWAVNRSISQPTPPFRIATIISIMQKYVDGGSTNKQSA